MADGENHTTAQGPLTSWCWTCSSSATLALIAIPIILITAAGSALALRAWPFFVQERVRQGRSFRFDS